MSLAHTVGTLNSVSIFFRLFSLFRTIALAARELNLLINFSKNNLIHTHRGRTTGRPLETIQYVSKSPFYAA